MGEENVNDSVGVMNVLDNLPLSFQKDLKITRPLEFDDDDESVESVNSCEEYIEFESHRDDNALEMAISLKWPSSNGAIENKRIRLATVLEPDEIAPLFAGAQWAGTRVWDAAVRAMQYLESNYNEEMKSGKSLCELGCGLGVPGMIYHMLGGNVVLTDQECIMSQMTKNCAETFSETYIETSTTTAMTPSDKNKKNTIMTHPLSWSREGFHDLLTHTGYNNNDNPGFDIVLNCDCVYEPLYGKSWNLLVEVIDECLKVNPNCIVLTSVERRYADGIEHFISKMEQSPNVQCVELVREKDPRNIEIYLTKGKPFS